MIAFSIFNRSHRIALPRPLSRMAGAVFLSACLAAAPTSAGEEKIIPSDSEPYSFFGASVATSANADVLMIGAPRDNGAGLNIGAAYIFVRPAKSWLEMKLIPGDGLIHDKYGTSVAISSDGRVAVVGSPYHGDNGSVYVYVDSSGGAWVSIPNEVKLNVSDGNYAGAFGFSVGVSADGRTIVVGAPTADGAGPRSGAVYVYRDSSPSGDWSTPPEEFKIAPSSIGREDRFGESVSIDGNGELVLAGSPFAEGSLEDQGAAHIIFDWDTPIPQSRLLRPTSFYSGARFGSTVSLSADGTTAMIGSYRALLHQGEVYFFSDPTGAWASVPDPTLVTAANGEFNGFGYSVSIDAAGEVAAVGEPSCDDNGDQSGAVYVLKDTSPSGNWSQWSESKIIASDGTYDDYFGHAVHLSDDGDRLLVGEDYDGSLGFGTGAAYLYSGPPVPVELVALSVK